MTSEQQEKELRRAGEARQILDSSLFREARADIEGKLADMRRRVPITATDMHTRLILMDQLWGYVLDYFEQTAQTGKLAELQLKEAEERRQSWLERMRAFTMSGRGAL